MALQHGLAQMASFFYPDYTVGTGISPVPAFRLVDFAVVRVTTDRELALGLTLPRRKIFNL
ncbi:hypothetical protein AN477_19235 [Alicyclobacillus ferrooxydans]|uniref:Uncharacterized protein n=1 Tax=Alicyclobacillus ferrooxydans TaxID=471514 RepID=A0A0P9CRP5_9BACL|nr:hypothetical protein AN477_19235 [Alicyclobacillus ferrooxydans]